MIFRIENHLSRANLWRFFEFQAIALHIWYIVLYLLASPEHIFPFIESSWKNTLTTHGKGVVSKKSSSKSSSCLLQEYEVVLDSSPRLMKYLQILKLNFKGAKISKINKYHWRTLGMRFKSYLVHWYAKKWKFIPRKV